MRRLLEDFDVVFDLDYRVGGIPLRDLVEQTVSAVDGDSLDDWGTEGRRTQISSATRRFVRFYYRPHLFPGMDLRLRLAHQLQFHLLPREVPAGTPVSIAAVLESYCHLSGDLFGWETLRDGRFLIWIVDMSGHGLRAGLASAVLRILIDSLRDRSRVGALATELNKALHRCVRPDHYGLFATAFFMAIGEDGRAVYSSAGHPTMWLRRVQGKIEGLDSINLPIGLFDGTQYETRDIRLAPGDFLLLYTDGLVETTGHDGEAFGVERLRRIVAREFREPEEMTGAIYEEITGRQDIDKLEDDVTFISVRVDPTPR